MPVGETIVEAALEEVSETVLVLERVVQVWRDSLPVGERARVAGGDRRPPLGVKPPVLLTLHTAQSNLTFSHLFLSIHTEECVSGWTTRSLQSLSCSVCMLLSTFVMSHIVTW